MANVPSSTIKHQHNINYSCIGKYTIVPWILYVPPKKRLNKPSISRSEFDTLSPVYERHLHNVVGKNDYDGPKGSRAGQTPAVYTGYFIKQRNTLKKKKTPFIFLKGNSSVNKNPEHSRMSLKRDHHPTIIFEGQFIQNSHFIWTSLYMDLGTHEFGLQTEETTTTAQV